MPGSSAVLVLLALASVGVAASSLERSRGFERSLPTLALVVSYGLGLLCLRFALGVSGFALGVIYAAWTGVGVAAVAIERVRKATAPWGGKAIGPVGAMARVGLGLGLVGSVVAGQLATRPILAPWLLGLVAFPGLALAWHGWRIRRDPAPFHDASPRSVTLSVALPIALYLTWWYAPAFSAASDGTLIFLGLSMVVAALRGYGGCDMLAVSNWLLGRRDQIACAVFTPIDALERRRS